MSITPTFEDASQADFADAIMLFFRGASAADLVVSLASSTQVSITEGSKTLLVPFTAFANPAVFGGGGILSLRSTGVFSSSQGGTGNDYMIGDVRSADYPNSLSGGAGNDVLQGGSGSDVLTGGSGSDIFRFDQGDSGLFTGAGHNRSGEFDTITDFDASQDRLQFFGLSAGSSSNFKILAATGSDQAAEQAANAAFASDHGLRYVVVQEGSNAAVYYSDGDGGEAHGLIMLSNTDSHSLVPGIIAGGLAAAPVTNQAIEGLNIYGLFESLAGGAGDDTISAGDNWVTAWGGLGADVFRLTAPHSGMLIGDFQPGQDHLDFGLAAATASNFARAGSAVDATSALTVAQAAVVNNSSLLYVVVDVWGGQPGPQGAEVFVNGPYGVNSHQAAFLEYAHAQEITASDILGSGAGGGTSPGAGAGAGSGTGTGAGAGAGAGSTSALTLTGTAADDVLEGGVGNDTIVGGDGHNVLHGNDGNDVITGGSGFDDINGNRGNDTVHAGAGDDWVSGGQNDDQVYGDDGHDLVYGNLGNDTVSGGNGDDWIRGGQGDDIVNGDAGNDLIWGDRGDDTLTGGAGADQFHTFAGAGIDRVTDFNGAEGDRIVIDDRTTYTVAASGSDTVINLSTGDTVILQGVALSGFHSDWISFSN